jgi:ribosome-binding protein aMBF1 (putative translation factor)
MKATLEFNLPEESEEYQIAVDGMKWRAVVSDALEVLRRERKYAELSQSDLAYNEKISEKIGQLIGEQGLSL